MDKVSQVLLDGDPSARGRGRRKFLQASSFMGVLAAVEPWFARLAHAQDQGARPVLQPNGGRVHVVPSTKETVRLGVYDANLPPILTIDLGDVISFPDTWSYFLNEMQPGVPVDTLARLRVDILEGASFYHLLIAVNKAEPGDVLEIRFQRIRPYEWGAVFNNPGSRTGLLPQDFAQGQIKYVDLDLGAMQGKFMPNITVPLKPFQGTFWGGAARGLFPPLSSRCDQLGAARPARGQSDLSELSEGSTLYVPVWQPGALIYRAIAMRCRETGISLTALETRMRKSCACRSFCTSKRTSPGRSPRRIRIGSSWVSTRTSTRQWLLPPRTRSSFCRPRRR